MADLYPLLEPSAHSLSLYDPPGGRLLAYQPGVPDLTFTITAVVRLSPMQYSEWHFMGPSETPDGGVLPIQELGRVRTRKVGDKKVEIALCELDGEFGANLEEAVRALRACNAQAGWEIVYVGEF
jgi:hypothetical protein